MMRRKRSLFRHDSEGTEGVQDGELRKKVARRKVGGSGKGLSPSRKRLEFKFEAKIITCSFRLKLRFLSSLRRSEQLG